MFKELRKKIEAKRLSEKIFWRLLVVAKDSGWEVIDVGQSLHKKLKDFHRTRLIRLNRLDVAPIPKALNEIRGFMVVRNESVRLPYLLDYYFGKGVDRFFIIDNGSTDGTVDLLLSKKNVHVFETKESYAKSDCGNLWLQMILRRYAKGHWCVIVDADEMLVYPNYEKISLKQFCLFLDKEGSTAMHSLLVDMYSNRPVAAAQYQRGDDLLLAFPYFDGTQEHVITIPGYETVWHRGGQTYLWC